MKKYIYSVALYFTLSSVAFLSCDNTDGFSIEHVNDSITVVKIYESAKFILLPIQESCSEALVKLDTGSAADTPMDIRLAVDSVDYYVPFPLEAASSTSTVKIEKVPSDAVCWKHISLSDTFDVKNTDYYRPEYHHTPLYGWMNDANGLVYKDGEYHLYYQYNPYGSKWGNMHWGHSVSRDLIHWKHLSPAIHRDTLGHIFSGSAIVDHNNTAGFGKDALLAFYTSASDKNGQIQCLAYSNDNGRTFNKYEKNPILTPFDDLKDFRDPKVFWYEPTKKWYMIVSADKNMRFYSSTDMKNWEYLSQFGDGYGVQPNQFECPDFIQLPVDGDKNKMKWVMIVNVNPGCLFGGSATEYFVGEFDGKEFKCDTNKSVTKWLDFGKDHYATVCFSNTGDRVVAIPWMSNWQYANATPIQQHRGGNALPRELSLYSKDGNIYLAANVVEEAKVLRKSTRVIDDFSLNGEYNVDKLNDGSSSALEIEMDINPGSSGIVGFELMNSKGEKTRIYIDVDKKKVVMDRTESGIVNLQQFGDMTVHDKETTDVRKIESVNYINDFALGTWAPLDLCEDEKYHFNVFVDKCSVELFVDGGRIAMTNLVFPTEIYDTLHFISENGVSEICNLKIYQLSL